MLVRAIQAPNLLLDTQRTTIITPHQRTNQFPPQRLEIDFQVQQFPIVVDEEMFILDGASAHVGEEFAVFLVFAELGGVGAEDARPEGGKEFAFHALLGVRLADDGALEVEELPVDGFEEGEEGGRVGEFRVDAFFEDGEELVEGALERLACALRPGGPEEVSHGAAKRGGEAGAAGLEDADAAEDGVDVIEGGGDGGQGEGGDGGEFALGPLHDDEDAVDVTVDVGEEFGEFNGQCLQTFAKIIQLSNDDRRRAHVGCAHALPEIPNSDPCLLQITYLLHAILRIKDEWLK